jgi:hypothetical protein
MSASYGNFREKLEPLYRSKSSSGVGALISEASDRKFLSSLKLLAIHKRAKMEDLVDLFISAGQDRWMFTFDVGKAEIVGVGKLIR